jgi:glycerol-1-phosphate dehydrogenase [NAD(P)+]
VEIQIPSLLRIKPHALYKLGKYLRKSGFNHVAVYYGEGIKDFFGQILEISLDSSEITVSVEDVVHGNAIEDVTVSAFRLPRDTQAIVAVGGGVAVDVAKYAGFLTQLPVVAVPTAISNDGFASPGASLTVGGRRTSCKATIPFGVVIDTTVIQGSPAPFTYSGIGDLISKYSAIADWKLAYHSVGEPVNDFAVMISLQSVTNLVSHPVKEVDDLAFLQLVAGALVMSGVAMEVCGSSRPASGSEHLISHAYDRLADPPSLHGLQVGVATLGTLWLHESPARETVLRVFEETGFTSFMRDHRLEREVFVEAIAAAPGIRPGYHTVLSEPGAVRRLQEHVADDPFWDDYLTATGPTSNPASSG